MIHHDVAVLVQDRHRHKQMELGRQMVREQNLPQAHDVDPLKLALEPDQQPSEAKEQVQGFTFF